MFNIAEKSNNYVFEGEKIPPQSLREELQVMNFVHCLHIVLVIAKYTDMFRRDFSGRRVGEEANLGGSFHAKENFLEGALDFPALFKKQLEIKLKKHVFSTENKEQH